VWQPCEILSAEVEVHRSGPDVTVQPNWQLIDGKGATLSSGALANRTLVAGEVNPVGKISFEVPASASGQKLTLRIQAGESATNQWHLWVLQPDTTPLNLADVQVFEFYREDVRTALMEGKSVWLRLHPNRMWGGHPGRFAPAFWSPVHFKEQVGTMGTLIDASHPAFESFPTESYTEWHWWDILTKSKAITINALPNSFRPTLQVIDRYERNDKLATIFEARVGPGRVFVSTIDFTNLENRLAAKTLKRSIEEYLASGSFHPAQSISLGELDRVFYREP
jgi:hypothetical protein